MAFNVSYIFEAVDRFSAVAGKIRGSMASVEAKADAVSKKVGEIGKNISGVGRDMLPATVGLGAVAGFALNASAKMETLQTSFKTMTGSAENAAAMVKDLRDFAASTPFELEGIGGATKQLLAFGVPQKEIIANLRQLGDISAGAGVPLEDMAAIFGKIKGKGKMMSEEILQLSDRGIPIVDVLAKGFRVTKDKVFEMASEGKISFDTFTKAMAKMTGKGGIFFDQMAEQSRTLGGLFSTFKDSATNSLTVLGDTMVKTFDLKKVLADSAVALDKLTARIQTFIATNPGLTKLILAFVAIVAIMAPILILVGAMASGFAALATAASVVAGAVMAINLPFLLWVAAIGLVIGALYLLWSNWDSISSWIGDGIESVVNWFTGMVTTVTALFNQLGAVARTIFDNSPLGMLINFAGGLISGESKAVIDVNINDKGGSVGSVESRSSGGASVNVGRNM